MVECTMNIQLEDTRSEIGLRTKSAFAVQHLMAAARFSRMCGKIELENIGNPLGAFFDEQTSYVSATVMLSVASMESNINEYFSDVENNFPELSEETRSVAFELIEKKSILEKYQYALTFKNREKISTSDQPFQNVSALIKLRNALVHFKPEWHDEQKEHKKLEQQLQGKFSINPAIEESGVFFPQQCISYGCTQWAVHTSLNFMKEFSSISGLIFRFEQFQDRLNPEVQIEE